MVKAPLVIPDERFGEAVVQILTEAEFPFTVAIWLKEDDRWELVLGTPLYEDVGPKAAYLQLISALSKDGPVALSDYPLRLESDRSPLMREFRKMARQSPARNLRTTGTIGGRWIQESYLYPLPARTSSRLRHK